MHGQEVTNGPHGRGNTHSGLVAIIPDVDFLQTTCWCEDRIVAVAQRDVVEGITYSCGLPTCRPPTSVACQVALVQWRIHGKGAGVRAHPAAGQRRTKALFPQGARARTRVVLRRRPRRTREDMVARIAAIEVAWRKGWSRKLIAEHLGLEYYDVTNALVLLRKQGRI